MLLYQLRSADLDFAMFMLFCPTDAYLWQPEQKQVLFFEQEQSFPFFEKKFPFQQYASQRPIQGRQTLQISWKNFFWKPGT